MKIVIDISKDIYKHILKAKSVPEILGIDIVNTINAVKNGTPLPKGHGDLIDQKELLNTFWKYCRDGDFGYHQAEDLIKSAFPIIKAEADKESKDEKESEWVLNVEKNAHH